MLLNIKLNKTGKIKDITYLLLLFSIIFIYPVKNAFSQNSPIDLKLDSLKRLSLNILEKNLNNLSGWNKVHAAEYLLWTKHPQNIYSIFLNQDKKFGHEPEYRIGIWRVLAEASRTLKEKEKWVNKISKAFLDTSGQDRIWAAETLAKLRVSPLKINPLITLEALDGNNSILSLYTRWSLCYSSKLLLISERKWLLNFLMLNNVPSTERRLAAYIIGKLGILPQQDWIILSGLSLKEPANSVAKVSLLGAAYTTAPILSEPTSKYHEIKGKLFTLRTKSNKEDLTEIAIALAKRGKINDIKILKTLINTNFSFLSESDNLDVKSAACYGVLAIINRIQ